jgi:transmembrane sensor
MSLRFIKQLEMSYNSYTAEDFVLDKEFRDWVMNPDTESNRYWKEWLDNNPKKSDIIKSAIKLIQVLPVEQHSLTKTEIDIIINNIEDAIDNPHAKSSFNSENVIPINPLVMVMREDNKENSFRYSRIAKIAATILLVLSLSYLLYDKPNLGSEAKLISKSELITKENPKGQKSTIFLKDGSKVILNANSKISYLKPFDEDQRVVALEGEAFFEVAKDKDRPFKVVSGVITTTALGTSFNIKAYPEVEQVKVSLATGKVKIARSDNGDLTSIVHFLEPGEELTYSPISGYTKTLFDKEEVLAWKDGIIYFKNADAEKVILKLEKWYGVEINTTNESSRKWSITAKFDNQSLENVLKSLAYSEKFDYSLNEKNVTIKY